MMAGWIKIHRDIANHWIFTDANRFKWWIDLLLSASFEDNKVLIKNRLIDVKRGQLIVSLSYLASRWKTSKKSVLNFLSLLEEDHMCNRYVHHKITILTICNYDSYQGDITPCGTDSGTDVETMWKQCGNELKNEEEIKNINNNNNAHAHTYVHTCEEFATRYRAESNWAEIGIILHASSIAHVQSLFDEFVLTCKHDGKTHREYDDFRRHFRQWASKRIQAEPTAPAAPTVTSNEQLFKMMGK